MGRHRTHRKNIKKRKNRRFYAQLYASWVEKQSENQWEIEQMQSEEISQRVHEKWMRETTKSQYLSRQKRKSTQRLHRRKSGCSVRVRANVKEVNGRNITASAIVPSHAGHITNEYSSNQIDILLIQEIQKRAYKAMQDATVCAYLSCFEGIDMMWTLWKSRFHEEYQRYHVRFTPGQVVVLLESIGATDLIKHPDQHFCMDVLLVEARDTELMYDLSLYLTQIASIVRMELVQNLASHLRGNVYIEFESEEGAKQAWQSLRVRYYKGRILDPELVPMVDWSASVCGAFIKGACTRANENCNYLHLYHCKQTSITLKKRKAEKGECFEDIVQYFEQPSSTNAQKG